MDREVRGVARGEEEVRGEGEAEVRMDSNTGPPLGAPMQIRHCFAISKHLVKIRNASVKLLRPQESVAYLL